MATAIEFAFAASWESCPAGKTFDVQWKPVGTTPGALKLSPGRDYRLTATADTTMADVTAMIAAPAEYNIRTIRLPHGGAIGTAELGKALAKLKAVEWVKLRARDAKLWVVEIMHAADRMIEFSLDGWPIDAVTEAVGHVPKARELHLRTDDYKKPFALGPLFRIGGVKTIEVEHCNYAKQQLDWTGLSGVTTLRKLETQHGDLSESFWSELGKCKQVVEYQMWWPEKVSAKPGSLKALKSLKKLEVPCLFTNIPKAFQTLAECPALAEVEIGPGTIDDPSAKELGAMPAITDCRLKEIKLTDAGMKALCRWPAIKSLDFWEDRGSPTPITARGFEALGTLGTLESLQLNGFHNVPPASWACLQQLTKLKKLHLFLSPPFDPLAAIGPIPSLRDLTLYGCETVGPAGFAVAQALPRLESLSLFAWRWAKYHIPADEIAAMRGLKHLSLRGYHLLTEAQLGRLAGLTKLETLKLGELDKIGDRGMASLGSLSNLRLLALEKMSKLTDQTLVDLAAFPTLESLSIRASTKITSVGYAALARCRRLTTLHLENARNLTGDIVLDLANALPLTDLKIRDCPELSENQWRSLTKHPTLQRFQSDYARVNDGVKALRPDWGTVRWELFQ